MKPLAILIALLSSFLGCSRSEYLGNTQELGDADGDKGGDSDGDNDIVHALIDFEAESGELVPSFALAADPNASGRTFVLDATSQGGTGPGQVSYVFNVVGSEPRDYFVFARVIAKNPAEDSFFVFVDDSEAFSYFTANCNWSDPWQWTFVPQQDLLGSCPLELAPQAFSLTPGEHTLVFASREGQSSVDRIVITTDIEFDGNDLTINP